MKKLLYIILAVAALSSCNKFLDLTPTDSVSDNVIWESTTNAEYAINYIYSYTYDIAASQTSVGLSEALTDMFKYGSYNYNALCYIPSEIAYGDESTLSASYVDTYLGTWSTWYGAVRRTNQAISELYSKGKMSDEDKTRLAAELRFMRAYIYFDLVKRYKEVILYDEDLTQIAKDRKVSTEEECWNFILDDLKYAAENLPEASAANGRINKGMAWAFITRSMLYAGKYQEVIDAAAAVEALGYKLEDNYADAFTKSVTAGNKEAILQYQFMRSEQVTHNFDFYYTPGGDYYAKGEAGGGYGTPTQEMVESYELATGGFPNWTPWHGTTTDTPPYADLEPRFQATVLYNGAIWKNRAIEPFVGGTDGWCTWNTDREPKGRTTTGYYLRKMVDETHNVITQSGSVSPVTILRYGEVLLNKAEAAYYLNKEDIANEAVKLIRNRVGLPYTAKAGMALWNAIRQERKVELAMEGLWYWDLRRWGVAHKAYPEGLSGYQQHGLKIEYDMATDTYTYTYVSVDDSDRKFPQKLYRFPMPVSELSTNTLVDQYPEWK
ncbi:MAG: RagB/SusD family nutrient uptake outer membrane protein [Bacteroidales bacterium]|nr:RagB/SusD family nutrient uptake outer membrane protein [Bacteroidales bacterium]